MRIEPRKSGYPLKQKRLYGKSLIRSGPHVFLKNLLVFCILMFPLLAAGINITCLMQPRPVAADHYWNEVARYLAGMDISEKSVLWEKTRDPRYRDHVTFMDKLWGMIEKETIELVVPWRQDNIPRAGKYAPAFYPLSGADFINLYTLFPDSREYLMVAMEQPGDAGALRDHQSKRLIDGLIPIQRSIYLYGVNNYFQTKVMMKEMNNTLLSGTAPVLLIFMARLGLTITNVENVGIDEKGALVRLSEAKIPKNRGKAVTGIRISFTGKGGGSSRELVYLSMRLEARSVSPSTPEGVFFNRLKNAKTMLKSAVYILQDSRWEPLKSFILDRSVLVVQDDSGILFRDFNKRWDITLYGAYKPILNLPGCRVVRQGDLAESYRAKSRPLPFNFGYGILLGPGQSNLMLAKKKI
jgi:hypothetical protein